MSNYRESGQCTQCAAMMINGVYCHETGCPVARMEYILSHGGLDEVQDDDNM